MNGYSISIITDYSGFSCKSLLLERISLLLTCLLKIFHSWTSLKYVLNYALNTYKKKQKIEMDFVKQVVITEKWSNTNWKLFILKLSDSYIRFIAL